MDKIAFLFAGQGAQYPGMGRDLYTKNKTARAVLDALEEKRPGTRRQCFEGTQEELVHTANTQPWMFAVELAAAQALREAGVSPQGTAGFSLGEVAALTFAGAFSLDQGFSLVCRRGEIMEVAAKKYPGTMVAVLKLKNEQVERFTRLITIVKDSWSWRERKRKWTAFAGRLQRPAAAQKDWRLAAGSIPR